MSDYPVFHDGDQIAYLPMHAEVDINHPDVEFGFVSTVNDAAGLASVFCRFWHKGRPGDLRTVHNSELCHKRYLRLHQSVDDWKIDAANIKIVLAQMTHGDL
jgi:hypothetical protein